MEPPYFPIFKPKFLKFNFLGLNGSRLSTGGNYPAAAFFAKLGASEYAKASPAIEKNIKKTGANIKNVFWYFVE